MMLVSSDGVLLYRSPGRRGRGPTAAAMMDIVWLCMVDGQQTVKQLKW